MMIFFENKITDAFFAYSIKSIEKEIDLNFFLLNSNMKLKEKSTHRRKFGFQSKLS